MKTKTNTYFYDVLTHTLDNIATTKTCLKNQSQYLETHTRYYYEFIQYQSKSDDNTNTILQKTVSKIYTNNILTFDFIASSLIHIDYNTIEYDFKMRRND